MGVSVFRWERGWGVVVGFLVVLVVVFVVLVLVVIGIHAILGMEERSDFDVRSRRAKGGDDLGEAVAKEIVECLGCGARRARC